jgi:hypothetical protein
MKNFLVLLFATTGGLFAQQQPQLSALKWTEPVPTQVVGQIPPGWQIVELKDQKITHGPFQLPDGQWVTLTTPKYVLQPMLDSGSLYLLEPGFNPKDPSGNSRAGTLSNLLYTEMEALRVSSENLRPIMEQFAKVQAYAQQEDSGSGGSPSGSNAKAQPLEEQMPQLPGSISAAPTPASAPTPIPMPTSTPSPVQPSPTPSPLSSPAGAPTPKSDAAHGHHGKKPVKKPAAPSGSPPSQSEASPTLTPKKP